MSHYRRIDGQTDSETKRQMLMGLRRTGVETSTCLVSPESPLRLSLKGRIFCNFACFGLLKNAISNVN